MKHPDYRAVDSVMTHFDPSPRIRRFLWALLYVAACWRLPEIITAIRWW